MATRTVRFFVVELRDKAGVAVSPPKDFWNRLFNAHDAKGDVTQALAKKYGEGDYVGLFYKNPDDSPSYLYVGKSRAKIDWPDTVRTGGKSITFLANTTGISSLLEPARLKPVEGTPFVAVVRSSAGPLPGAIQDLLEHAYQQVKPGYTLELLPYTLDGQLERLKASFGATTIAVKVRDLHGAKGDIAKAAKSLQEAIGMDVDVSIGLSMRGTDDVVSQKRMKKSLLRFLRTTSVKSARSTVVEANPDNAAETVRSIVDFVEHKVAYPIEVKTDSVSDAEYLRVLDTAITRFLSEVAVSDDEN